MTFEINISSYVRLRNNYLEYKIFTFLIAARTSSLTLRHNRVLIIDYCDQIKCVSHQKNRLPYTRYLVFFWHVTFFFYFYIIKM